MNVIYHHRTAGDRVERVHIMGIVEALREMGHAVLISSPPGCDPETKSEPATLRGATKPSRSDKTLRARLKRFARQGSPLLFELAELAYNFYSFADMLRLSLRARPHLIYERATSNSIAPTLIAKLFGIPIVQEINITSEIGRLRPLVLRRTTQAIERWMLRNAGAQITVSKNFKQMIIDAGLPGSAEALISPNAVSASRFSEDTPLPAGHEKIKPEGAILIGYVGAFVPYHGVEWLVDLAPKLRERHPECRWLLVGDGVMRPTVEALLVEKRIADLFILTGMVRHEEIPGYIKLMDVGVLPKSNLHGSPMKVLEYMAMAKASLAPRLPPVEEVIRDGINGLLFESENENDFMAKLCQLLQDEKLRSRLGAQARKDILARFTWSANVRQLLDHLERKGFQLPAAATAHSATAGRAESAK